MAASTGSSGGGTFGDDCRYTVEQLGDALKWPARQIVQEPGYTYSSHERSASKDGSEGNGTPAAAMEAEPAIPCR